MATAMVVFLVELTGGKAASASVPYADSLNCTFLLAGSAIRYIAASDSGAPNAPAHPRKPDDGCPFRPGGMTAWKPHFSLPSVASSLPIVDQSWAPRGLRPGDSAALGPQDGKDPVQSSASGADGKNQMSKNKKSKGKYSPSATAGSPGHIFWVVPAFKVNYQSGGFKPLTPKEKFEEWAQSAYDPLGLGVGAFEAGTLEYSSSDGFCGYGSGWANYGKCFGSLELDANDSSFFGDFVFTVWWHQDPRYFRLGEGSFGRRALYAISRVAITYNDSGKNVFYSSGLAGTGMAAVVSNLYYPQQDRGVGHTVTRVAIDLGNTAIYNASAEFWPDIHKWLLRRF